MDQVTIKASVAAHGLRKGDQVTVAETPAIAGAIRSGVFQLIERHTAETPDGTGDVFQGETLLGVTASHVDPVSLMHGDTAERPVPPADMVFCKCMSPTCNNPHYQDWLDEQQQPEVAPDNSTVVPSHQPGTRPSSG